MVDFEKRVVSIIRLHKRICLFDEAKVGAWRAANRQNRFKKSKKR
jgi:hypothetical protein